MGLGGARAPCAPPLWIRHCVEEVASSHENLAETHRTERQIARETGIRKSSVYTFGVFILTLTVLEILIFWVALFEI